MRAYVARSFFRSASMAALALASSAAAYKVHGGCVVVGRNQHKTHGAYEEAAVCGHMGVRVEGAVYCEAVGGGSS